MKIAASRSPSVFATNNRIVRQRHYLGPISGAHFNPAVSLVEALRGKLTLRQTVAYVIVQIAGCCLGALPAHAMFEMPLLQASLHLRTGPAQWLSEAGATAGLILVVVGVGRTERGGLAGIRLDRGGLLVYGVNLVRQSRDYDRAVSQQHLFRYCPCSCRRVHRVATVRRGCRPSPGKIPSTAEHGSALLRWHKGSPEWRHYDGEGGCGARANGCHNSARTMIGIPTTAGTSQYASGGSSRQSGRFFPLST